MKKDPDEINFYNKIKEVSDTWDFSSDGLAYHHYFDCKTEEDRNWNKKISSK